jgi:hypothetical protein
VPDAAYDFVADGWSEALGILQASGELIAVRLPHGFVGVCMIRVDQIPRRRGSGRREVVNR